MTPWAIDILSQYSSITHVSMGSFRRIAMTMPDREAPAPTKKAEAPSIPVVQARDLLRGQREICIVLDGERYRLRITRTDKLILTK